MTRTCEGHEDCAEQDLVGTHHIVAVLLNLAALEALDAFPFGHPDDEGGGGSQDNETWKGLDEEKCTMMERRMHFSR